MYLVICLLFAGAAYAQAPVQPQPGLQSMVVLEIRLKGVPTATNPSPTVKLITWQPKTVDARTFSYTQTCWNKTAICPKVVAVTVRTFLRLPWDGSINVTRFLLCDSSECLLPPFTPLQAKPGEAYKFSYDRVTAQWTEPPTVIPAP